MVELSQFEFGQIINCERSTQRMSCDSSCEKIAPRSQGGVEDNLLSPACAVFQLWAALGQCLSLITYITVRGTNSNLLGSLTDCELSLESLTTGGGTSWDWRLSVCAVPFILMKKELESPSSFMKDRFDDRQMTHWFWSRFPGCLNDHNILSLQCWWWVRLSLSLTLIATLKRNIC